MGWINLDKWTFLDEVIFSLFVYHLGWLLGNAYTYGRLSCMAFLCRGVSVIDLL